MAQLRTVLDPGERLKLVDQSNARKRSPLPRHACTHEQHGTHDTLAHLHLHLHMHMHMHVPIPIPIPMPILIPILVPIPIPIAIAIAIAVAVAVAVAVAIAIAIAMAIAIAIVIAVAVAIAIVIAIALGAPRSRVFSCVDTRVAGRQVSRNERPFGRGPEELVGGLELYIYIYIYICMEPGFGAHGQPRRSTRDALSHYLACAYVNIGVCIYLVGPGNVGGVSG